MNTKFTKVCITDENSIPYKAMNSVEVIKTIKEQIDKNIENEQNLGVLDDDDSLVITLSSVAFKYHNPQIIDNKLYVDIEVLKTPHGLVMEKLFKSNDDFRCTAIGTGIVLDHNIIQDYTLIYIKAEPYLLN